MKTVTAAFTAIVYTRNTSITNIYNIPINSWQTSAFKVVVGDFVWDSHMRFPRLSETATQEPL